MSKMPYRSLFCATIFCISASTSYAEDDLFFLVTAEGVSCVASHADDYSISEGETVFVSMTECNGGSNGQLNLMDMVQNSAPDISLADKDGPDEIVALNSNDLDCLQSLSLPAGGELLAFYPDGCRLVEK